MNNTVKPHIAPLLSLTYDRHPLAYIIEVKDGQQFIDDFYAHLHGRDALRCARAEHKTEVSGCRHQSALVRRLSLIVELACQETKAKEEGR